MDAIASIYYWVKLVLLIVVVVLAVWGAVRASGNRVLLPWRAVVQAVLAVVAFAAVVWLGGAAFGVVWAIVLMALGLAAGFLTGRRERSWAQAGRVCVRRSALASWVWAVAVILVTVTLLFGSSYLFALAALVMAFGLGMVLGQIAGEFAASGRQAEGAVA
jgi:hypothetical protein